MKTSFYCVFFVFFYLEEQMNSCLVETVDSKVLRSKSLRSALWCAGSFLAIICSLVCCAVFDLVFSSRDGIAVAMMFACGFFLATMWLGVKALYFFVRYKIALRPPRQKSETDAGSRVREKHKLVEFITRLSTAVAKVTKTTGDTLGGFGEKHDSAVVNGSILLLCCGAFFWWVHPHFPEDTLTVVWVWGVFLGTLLSVLYKSKLSLSSFPFMKAQCLKNRPLLRCVIAIAELLVVASFFFVLLIFSFWVTGLILVAVTVLVGALVRFI